MSEQSVKCSGCGLVFKSSAAQRNHGRYSKTCTPEMRFWGKIVKGDGCWLWQAAVNTTGYGMANWSGRKNIVAHRLAYELLRGPIPAGMLALHKCDTPRCCNPDHLFFGTDADNHADKVAKGRHPTKLTVAQVREIRELLKTPMLLKDIAAKYSVGATIISGIKKGYRWKHV